MSTTLPRLALAALLALSILITGCEKSKVTAENFDKVKVGMTVSEVKALLGKSYVDETASAGYNAGNTGLSTSQTPENTYVWSSKTLKIIIVFKDGKVVQPPQKKDI